ncbi:hypothetical protein A33Q_4539 [Indibacter alkaliphilus LW1]|uniref:Uncharacterized protein n=1 Tax=Indibacter alkaliphilus (strain CCUG 57479 / KCTC 22604 / LW1) TaxID=1189612 RepID=S2DKD2_INDAL|nr:hypothetical protein A33Q_4539 [Indibacter alkaliphilus LW1]
MVNTAKWHKFAIRFQKDGRKIDKDKEREVDKIKKNIFFIFSFAS